MSEILDKYDIRFQSRQIVPPNPQPANDKVAQDGSFEPFYGFACIAWIERESNIYQPLCNLQNEIKKSKLEKTKLEDFFTFLAPESFHITICDINASTNPGRCFDKRIIDKVEAAMKDIRIPTEVSAKIQGIGLKRTIAPLVKFDNNEKSLKEIYGIEKKIKVPIRELEDEIKQSLNVKMRDFAGHISLAYCFRDPEKEKKTGEEIRTILRSYENSNWGEFTFSKIHLTYFIDMNTYIPMLTHYLKSGEVIRHNAVIKMLESFINQFRASRNLLENYTETIQP